jgi:hypothetical protein
MALYETDDYLKLLPSFHRWQPQFRATVESLTSFQVAMAKFVADIPRQFDIDEAIGVQLDVVGQWVGRDRMVKIPVDNLWFSFGDARKGWGLGYWKGIYDQDLGITALDDESYRKLLYAKILVNNWDGTFETARNLLNSYFGSVSPGTSFFIDDHGDGSATYAMTGKIPPPLYLALFSWDYLPLEPAGMKTYYRVVSVDNTPMFGWGVQNGQVAGWGTGSWGTDPEKVLYRDTARALDFTDPLAGTLIPGAV